MDDKLKVAVALMSENKCVDTSDGWYFSERQKQRNAIEDLFKSATIFKTAVSNLVGSGVAGGTIPVVVGGVAVPSPEPSSSSSSSSSSPSSNKLATPIHTATPLVINNYNNMSIFGKEVVGNDGRKILLTQRETTKEDYEGDSSASSQKRFMDMNLNHVTLSTATASARCPA